jgi:hypothetical protein
MFIQIMRYQVDTLLSPSLADGKIEAEVTPDIKNPTPLLILATPEYSPRLLLMANAPTAEIAEPSFAALVAAMQQLTLVLNG